MRDLLLLWILVGGAAATGAELQSQVDRPYELAVCLRFSDDPIFTRFFVESVKRQVHGQLANYFGLLAEVEVKTRHRLLEKLTGTHLAGLAMSPAEFVQEEVLNKVFLVDISFNSSTYQIQWRQVDGDVQRVGPLYARTTPDRQWLAKAICLAVKEDFAPVALVEPIAGTENVRLKFLGASRSPRLSAWLDSGCVLQPFWVIRQRDGTLVRMPLPHTLLRIKEGKDWKQARVVPGRAKHWKRTARVAGFQAIKLTTQVGQFQLRLVDSDAGSPVLDCMVYASSTDFSENDQDRLPAADRAGYVNANKDFEHLAHITIRRGSAKFQTLLPITSEFCELVYRLPADPKAGKKNQWQRQLRYCIQDVQVLQSTLDHHVREVNVLNEKKHYEEALYSTRSQTAVLGWSYQLSVVSN